MSLDASGESSESVATGSAPASSESAKSGYSVTDPGASLEGFEPKTLAQLRAENGLDTPSETSDDASGKTTEETTEKPSDESADSSEISDELLDRALELGYTLDEMKEFQDAKSLEKEVSRVERLRSRLEERTSGKKVDAAPEKPAEKPEPKWDELIEQGHDPDTIAVMKDNWQQAKEARDLAQQLLQAEQSRAFDAQCERFDETLNKLDGFEEILGKGRRADLAKKSPEAAENRQKVFSKMLMLKRGYEAAGEPIPAESDLIQEAVQASFYKHAQQTARSRLKSDIKKAGSQALSRPNSGGSKPLVGDSKALQIEQDFWKSHGL